MYEAFTRKLKELPPQPTLISADPSVVEPLISDSDDVRPGKAKEPAFVRSHNNDPSNNQVVIKATPLTDTIKKRSETNNDFYYEPFVFKESNRDVCGLVTSMFTKRIQDYDMSDGIRVPTNLRTYDGTTDPDDHLTVFMGMMDVHKLLKLVMV